jgi:glutaconate CoA-transferase subunit B
MKKTTCFTIDELMIVCLARTIKDGDTMFNGVAAALPFAAMLLAQKTEAPNAVFIGGLQGAINPIFPFLPPNSVDNVFTHNSEMTIPVADIFNMAQRNGLGRIFFGGGQIDRYGNANNTLIGSVKQIKVKLPGAAGASSLACYANHFTLWTTKHRLSPKAKLGNNFVIADHAGFVTTFGHHSRKGARADMGLSGGGPDWLVTDLGVFDFNTPGKELRLRYIHPGVTVDTLLENTGFLPEIAPNLTVTPCPTPGQLALIREIDPLGVCKTLFSEEQLRVKYEIQ